MSKRCELQKEYYQQHGAYKGTGKYTDNYVLWLEKKVLELKCESDNRLIKMKRHEIVDKIQDIQLNVDKIGFKRQNEYDLHLREELAEWLMEISEPPIVARKYE